MDTKATTRLLERKERQTSLRRAHILEAAASEFATKGFDGAQVGAIAAHAEVSLASVYGLFPSKEQLFQAVIETTAQAMRATRFVRGSRPLRTRASVCSR